MRTLINFLTLSIKVKNIGTMTQTLGTQKFKNRTMIFLIEFVILLSRLHDYQISQTIGQSTCLKLFSWQKVKNHEKK